MINITIGDKQYKVKEATETEDKIKGLQNVENLPENEGMIFYFDPPQRVEMWMRDTLIPLDIIYINDDQEVIGVEQGKPNDDTLLGYDDVAYVVEVNSGSGIKKGDELEFDDSDNNYVMKVLAPDGSSQMDLEGGERIVSRKETKVLIKKAKKAQDSKNKRIIKHQVDIYLKYLISRIIEIQNMYQHQRLINYINNNNKF